VTTSVSTKPVESRKRAPSKPRVQRAPFWIVSHVVDVAQASNLRHVEGLLVRPRPPVEPDALQVGLVGPRPVPLLGDVLELAGPVLADRPGGLADGLDPPLQRLQVVVRPRLAVEVEEVRVLDLALGDGLGLAVGLLGHRAAAGPSGRGRLQAPGVVQDPLGDVGQHRLVGGDEPGQLHPVGLIEVLERRARAVVGVGRARQGHALPVGAASTVQPQDPLLPMSNIPASSHSDDDGEQRAVGQLLGLLGV
jgi:hypothetical protein